MSATFRLSDYPKVSAARIQGKLVTERADAPYCVSRDAEEAGH